MPVVVSQHSAISGGSGAPATATARTVGREGGGPFSIRMTLVGTPTITVDRDSAAMRRQCSAFQWGSRSMTSAAPRRRLYRHMPPIPWVSGVIGSTRSCSVIPSLDVKLSNVTCLRRAESEASLGIPVVPEVRAISTIRSGSGPAALGEGRPSAGSSGKSRTTSTGRAFSLIQRSSCVPSPSGMGRTMAPRSGTASSRATYCHTFGSWTPTTSPSRTPLAASTFCSRRTWPSSCSKVISSPSCHTARLDPRRAAFHSR